MKEKILIVDDEGLIRNFIKDTLEPLDFYIVTAENGQKGLELFKSEKFDIVITDIRMPKMDGHTVLREIKKIAPDTVVMMLTAHGTLHDACRAGKEGAFDYLEKPCDADTIEFKIQNAINHRKLLLEKSKLEETNKKLQAENIDLKNELKKRFKYDSIIGSSDKMKKIIDKLKVIADTRARVLITGESGTGKELIAKAIHYNSSRKNKKFLKINCAAMPATLLESELFGHEKGSFTGAMAKRIGIFEEADGGTVLLDEISEMAPELQAKLLRVLQENEIKPVGSNMPRNIDVRVISTTNRDLQQEIERGTFREDLYFRLNVVNIHLPPLRERKEEIVVLLEHFIEKFSGEYGKKIQSYSAEALSRLMENEWRGNIREFENSIERAVIACNTGELTCNNLDMLPDDEKKAETPKENAQVQEDESFYIKGKSLSEIEKVVILKTLDEHKWNKKQAASVLGITDRTLRNKLHAYGIM